MKELEVALALAQQAGQVALELQHLGIQSNKPDGEGPVSFADLEADRLIREGLKQAFPADTIITEETFQTGDLIPQSGRVWFVDPIDGTKDFINGGPDYCVMIGLAVDGIPILGVLFQPETGTIWYAADGVAKKVNSGQTQQLDINQKPLSPKGPVIALSRSHPSQFADWLTQDLKITQIVRQGSFGLKIALIAQGTVDCYLTATRKAKLWDSCAPYALLKAAGGIITGLNLKPLSFTDAIAHNAGVYASTPACWAHLKDPLKASLAKWQKL